MQGALRVMESFYHSIKFIKWIWVLFRTLPLKCIGFIIVRKEAKQPDPSKSMTKEKQDVTCFEFFLVEQKCFGKLTRRKLQNHWKHLVSQNRGKGLSVSIVEKQIQIMGAAENKSRSSWKQILEQGVTNPGNPCHPVTPSRVTSCYLGCSVV